MQKILVGALIAGACTLAGACEQRAMTSGHWEWQGNGHVWVPDHATLPRNEYAWRDDAPPSTAVRQVAHDADTRNAREQPRDLDRRLTR